MRKASHKLQQLGRDRVATVIATAPSVSAAARQLGVSRQSVHQWLRAGIAKRPARQPRVRAATLPAAAQRTPGGFERWVRARYHLSPAEEQLLAMAVDALRIAADASAKPETRLSAMKVSDRLIARLNLEEDHDGEAEETTAPQGSNVRPFRRGA